MEAERTIKVYHNITLTDEELEEAVKEWLTRRGYKLPPPDVEGHPSILGHGYAFRWETEQG